MNQLPPSEQAKRAEELRKLSASSIHTLNNMMFVISGYTHLLKTTLNDPEALENLNAIEQSVAKARETMADWKQKSEDLFPQEDLPL